MDNELDLLLRKKVIEVLDQMSEEKISQILENEVAKIFDIRYYGSPERVHSVTNKVIEMLAKKYVDENFNSIIAQIDQKVILNLVTSKMAQNVSERAR